MKESPSVLLTVGWSSFLMAAVLEMLVFSVVDPGQLHGFGGAALELGATAVYSLAFFVFWAVIAAAGLISHGLGRRAGPG
ncbi:MAG: hypothetical protein KGI90_03120 [Burkholderiales bacterium]|nr:hypothetical protein [Burkholderiales bacterium]MDE2276364.1 hypothetical protein [Burkholderiales bacterium]